MLTQQEALHAHAESVIGKAELMRSKPWAFIISGFFGGAYIGVGGVLMLNAAGPLVVADDPLAKLVSGLVFAVGLVIVVFAGSDLVTSTMMTVTQGVATKTLSVRNAAGLVTVTIVANFVGAMLFALVVHLSGVLVSNAAAGEMLGQVLQGRADQSVMELVARAILCNMLVCLAIWMSTRVTSVGAKITVIMLGIMAFVASGYEHVVANMTFYWLGVFAGDTNASIELFTSNMLWVGIGNFVGGGLIVGLGTWVVAGSPKLLPTQVESSRDDRYQSLPPDLSH